MAETTAIQWTDHTWNPWIGCSKVHTGCLNCYAEADMDKRRGRARWGIHGTRSRTSEAYWKQPIKWNKDAEAAGVRRRVFCSSLADVFEDWGANPIVDSRGDVIVGPNGLQRITMNDIRHELFELIDKTPWLDWQLLTKRPENIRKMWWGHTVTGFMPCYRENVWLGTSISDQETADKAIPELLKCRDLSPVLFLSAEPLVGPIDLQRGIQSADGFVTQADGSPKHVADGANSINWVIVGGESGPGARQCNIEWIDDIKEQCRNAGVSCFVKQFGANSVQPTLQGEIVPVRFEDHKGGDMSEWPEDLRVREFPLAANQ